MPTDSSEQITENTGTVPQSSAPPEAATADDGMHTSAVPAGYDPGSVARSAGLSVPFGGGPSGTFVGSGPSDGLAAQLARGQSHRPAGRRYTVLKEHAKGGMGQVSIAVDEELEREVALKEIQPRYAYDSSVAARFVLEARVTGRLEHPGIVPVYGLSRHPDGRPYYAMRFICGESLQDAIAAFHKADTPGRDHHERALAFRQLLTRFVDVCNTIAYAHSRGILHRDLKPANVMLGAFGETLVVDWGLAKDTAAAPPSSVGRTVVIPTLAFERAVPQPEPDAEGETKTAIQPPRDVSLAGPPGSEGELTEHGKAMGTPAFMAPEQADGRWDDVGLLADIYSLGATLYVLLTGKSPFRGETQDILDRVKRGEVTPPNDHKTDLPPGLVAVCRKAMALRPADRYPTALDLAADVERWMADEPLSVYREPWSVRLIRWARRHRNLVFACVAVLVTALATITVGYLRVHAEQRETAKAKDATEKANGELKDEKEKVEQAEKLAVRSREAARLALLTLTDDAIGEILTAQHEPTGKQRQFLEGVVKLYRQFIQEAPESHDSKLFVAGAYFRVGRLQVRLGDKRAAELSYRRVFELGEGQAGEAWEQLRGETHLYDGIRLLTLNRFEDAEKKFQEARKPFYDFIVADDQAKRRSKPEYWQRLGQAEDRLGLALYKQDRYPEAEDWFRNALSNRRVLLGYDANDPEYLFRIAQSLRQIAMVCYKTGRRLEAVENADEAHGVCTRLLKADPTSAVYLALTAEVEGMLSIVTTTDTGAAGGRAASSPAAGKSAHRAESRRYAETAVGHWSDLVRLYPADIGYRQQLAVSNLNLAAAELRAGRTRPAGEALKAADLVLTSLELQLPDDNYTASLRGRLHHSRAVRWRDSGELDKARTAAEEAVAVAEKLTNRSPKSVTHLDDLACYQIELATIQTRDDKRDAARTSLDAAWQNMAKVVAQPGIAVDDADFKENVRCYGRAAVDLPTKPEELDGLYVVADRILKWGVNPDAERFAAASILGRAAIRSLEVQLGGDQDAAVDFATAALEKLKELSHGYEWLPRIQAEPDLLLVRQLDEFAKMARGFREPAPAPRSATSSAP